MLEQIGRELLPDRPLRDLGVLLNMHLTHETASLGETLRRAGAAILFLASNRNPAPAGVLDRARACGTLCDSLDHAAEFEPRLVVEGNGRVFRDSHERPSAWPSLTAISMHTSGGGALVDAYDPSALRVSVVAVYRDRLKQQWETGLGTAQSVIAALLRGLQRPLAGRTTLVVGFGSVGSGVARMLRASGARVVVAEIREEPELRARCEGFPVVSIADGLAVAELCLTATGRRGVIMRSHLAGARGEIVLANISNEAREIDLEGCVAGRRQGPWLQAWTAGTNRVFLLGGGMQVNHVVEEGNPAELMDLSFSIHALVVAWLAENALAPGVYEVPDHIHSLVARRYVCSLR
jgi:adenosylhomocysteinase